MGRPGERSVHLADGSVEPEAQTLGVGQSFLLERQKTKWSCRSEDGKYYHGFRSLRALLKSYVGGILCEKAYCYGMKNARAKYWLSQYPKQVTCRVTMRCTGPLPAALC